MMSDSRRASRPPLTDGSVIDPTRADSTHNPKLICNTTTHRACRTVPPNVAARRRSALAGAFPITGGVFGDFDGMPLAPLREAALERAVVHTARDEAERDSCE